MTYCINPNHVVDPPTQEVRKNVCPRCRDPLVPVVGARTPHWRHFASSITYGTTDELSTWHLACTDAARDAGLAVEVPRLDGKRRADAINPFSGTIIEFQHSSLSQQEVEQREADWHPRVGVWYVAKGVRIHGNKWRVWADKGSEELPDADHLWKLLHYTAWWTNPALPISDIDLDAYVADAPPGWSEWFAPRDRWWSR